MGTYLMMLYVTLEQETALKELFLGNGWGYCKPDLRVGTDVVGPLVQGTISTPAVDTDGETSTPATKRLRKGSRKSLPLPRPSSDIGKQPGSGKAKSKQGVTAVTHTGSESTTNNKFASPLTEHDFDIEGFLATAVIKVEQTNADDADDNDSNVDEVVEDDFVDECQISQNMTLHEVGSIEQGSDRILSATPGTSSMASTPRTSGRKRKLPKKVAENLEEPADDNADVAEPETKTNDKAVPSCSTWNLRPLKEKPPEKETSLTGAERSQRWRDSMKENPEFYKTFKSVDALRKRLSRVKQVLTDDEKKRIRQRNRERQKKYRENRKRLDL